VIPLTNFLINKSREYCKPLYVYYDAKYDQGVRNKICLHNPLTKNNISKEFDGFIISINKLCSQFCINKEIAAVNEVCTELSDSYHTSVCGVKENEM
jgi:hypothetical protein